ncbi:hypothetical protein CLV81_1711 [Flagellimonas meridianipacifica]|uniref:Uncharacterized protein n=1 Tax=Flagellimonas meridianipacifica TaxID=1080225 RepID=A0A2T0MJE2_9FLAO|nr:hypothetical protein CLV81_1711 [Allomuricauda pacifica]
MDFYNTYFIGFLIVMLITFSVTALLRKRPELIDSVIDYIVFPLIAILFFYACFTTDWNVVKKRLSKDLREYRETQQNILKP